MKTYLIHLIQTLPDGSQRHQPIAEFNNFNQAQSYVQHYHGNLNGGQLHILEAEQHSIHFDKE